MQTVRATSMELLEIVVGKKRSLAMSMVERENNSEVQKKKGRVSKRSEEKNSKLVEAGSQPRQTQ